MSSRFAKNWLRNAFPVSGRILAETFDGWPWTRWWGSSADTIFLVDRLVGATLVRPRPWRKTGTRNLELDLGQYHLHRHPPLTICSVDLNLVILKIPHQRLRTQGPSPFIHRIKISNKVSHMLSDYDLMQLIWIKSMFIIKRAQSNVHHFNDSNLLIQQIYSAQA